MTQTTNSCCIFIFSTIGFVVLIIMAEIISYDNKLDHFKNKTCLVERIEYPTLLPTYDTYYRNSYRENTIENSNNLWSKCDCGLRCYALTSCVKIIVSIENKTSISKEYQIQKNTYTVKNEGGSKCSLYTNYCPSGNTVGYGNSKLENALQIYDEYINKSIDCYHNEGRDIVYMEKHYFYNLMELLIILCISIFMIIILICYKYELLVNILELCSKKETHHISEVEKYNISNKLTINTSQRIL